MRKYLFCRHSRFAILFAAWCLGAGGRGLATMAETNSPALAHISQGLHGYIAYGHEKSPPPSVFTAGMGFYSAVWALTDRPLAGFQIGLPGTWILPDNSDDRDTPPRAQRYAGPNLERARTDLGQRFSNRRRRIGLLAGQSFPLRPGEV